MSAQWGERVVRFAPAVVQNSSLLAASRRKEGLQYEADAKKPRFRIAPCAEEARFAGMEQLTGRGGFPARVRANNAAVGGISIDSATIGNYYSESSEMPYFAIFSLRVFRSMPRISAALDFLPSVAARTRAMCCCSSDSSGTSS